MDVEYSYNTANINTPLNISYAKLDNIIDCMDIFNHNTYGNTYTIIKKLKVNGNRAVYHVKDNNNKDMIIKFILKHNTTKKQLTSIKAFAKMNNHSFCKIYNIHEHDIFHVITMEYIKGYRMSEYFNIYDVTKEQAFKIVFDLVLSLSILHRNGYIHGDIKPDNIMICTNTDSYHYPVIIDFDLGRRIENPKRNANKFRKYNDRIHNIQDNDTCNYTRKPFGTRMYMSPEMLLEGKFSIKTDVWSLGSSLYSCIMNTLSTSCSESYSPKSNSIKSTFCTNNTTCTSSTSLISIDSDAPSIPLDISNSCNNSIFEYMVNRLEDNESVIISKYGTLFYNIVQTMLIIDIDKRPNMMELVRILRKSRYYKRIYVNKY